MHVTEEGYDGVHNSGSDVILVGSYSSYSYCDDNGLFARRDGHEHVTKLAIKVMENPNFVCRGYGYTVIGGHKFTDEQLKKALGFE